jgi:chromosome partitioning protein
MDYKSFEDHRKRNGTIADLLIDQPTLDIRLKKVKNNPATALHTIEQNGGKRFDLLPAELSLAWVVKNPAQMDYRLEKVLGKIKGGYDYVFIDCAPTDSVLTTMALTASEYLLIPMRPDRFSILGFTNLMETIKTFRANCPDPNNVQILGVVFTQVTGKSAVERQLMDEIAVAVKKEAVHLFSSNLKYSTSFIRSGHDQTPIFQTLYAKGRTKTAAKNIADELKNRTAVLSKAASSGKGNK